MTRSNCSMFHVKHRLRQTISAAQELLTQIGVED
jgi:hypothetical protein